MVLSQFVYCDVLDHGLHAVSKCVWYFDGSWSVDDGNDSGSCVHTQQDNPH